MSRITAAAALLAATVAAGPAMATTYTLDKIKINGLHSTEPAPLLAQLKDKPGDHITTNDILADQDALVKALEAVHITGGVKTSMATQGSHVTIIFDVQDNGVQAPVVTKVAPKLKAEIFAGNAKLTNDDLAAASGLKPGDDLSDAKIQAAELAIQAAYKKANVGVTISGAVDNSPGGATITWTIVETKVKKKKRNTEDEGGMKVDE